LGKLLRKAGEAETGRITGAKEFKSRRAKRLGWRLREPLSLQMPIRVFRVSRIFDFASAIYGPTIYGATIYRLNDLPGSVPRRGFR
jgi:hypothetical protein